ncbi:uncharacterized protein [Henckelia pumila]|uniref:uncharacterized protein n=1 Tax=Henckelia pumila TaxID=405737 RepID=UPI003C6E7610
MTRSRKIWKNLCARSYRRTLCEWRTSGTVPEIVDRDIWAGYEAHWATEGWQRLSQSYRNNKRSKPEGPGTGITKHVGGSRPCAVYADNLELNRDPTSYELLIATHRCPNGKFADEKSRRITAEVERRISENYTFRPDAEAHSEDDHPSVEETNNIFFDVVDGVSHRRVYGIGSVAEIIYLDEMTPRPRGPSRMRATVAAQDEAIRAAKEEARLAQEQSQRLEDEYRLARE